MSVKLSYFAWLNGLSPTASDPYAAAVTFSQIARPALRKAARIAEVPDLGALGCGFHLRAHHRAARIRPSDLEWRDTMGRPVLHRLGRGASDSLGPMAEAKGIAVLPKDVDHIAPGMPLVMEPLLE